MEIRVLGCYGQKIRNYDLTSFLINNSLLVDAGGVCDALTMDELRDINTMVISHAHLDHITGIFFMADNIVGEGLGTIQIHCIDEVKKLLEAHILNNYIWPDFTRIYSMDQPVLEFCTIKEDEFNPVNEFRVYPIRTVHPTPTNAFLIDDGDAALMYTSDTGPTRPGFWKKPQEQKNLRGIITEVSFPNQLQSIARVSGHMTPDDLAIETEKMGDLGVPIFVYHMKPNYVDLIKKEIEELRIPHVTLMEQGKTYKI